MTQLPPEGAAPTAPPVCPRHPDRESHVRCQRCGRPTCHDCQVPAAVGIQCVDCVREQNRGVRGARTAFGGSLATAGGRPVVTQAVIAVCVVVYLLQLASDEVTSRLAFEPAFAVSEPWRFVTAAFLHSTSFPLHILFNMYALWMVGPYLEAQLGRARFLALYLLSAVGGSAVFFALATPVDGQYYDQDWLTSTVGASGAVFGLFTALVVVNRRLQRPSGSIIAVIVVNAAIGFMPGIAWQAHLGGAITGLLVTAVLAYAPREQRMPVQVAGVVAVALLIVATVAVKVATLPAGVQV